MIGNLLLRGMLVGIVAGLLAFGFARLFGEPQVDSAIAFEESMHTGDAMAADAAAAMPADHHEDVELVSRPTQAGIGLFTGVVLYSAAFGGIFALVFAFAYGRIGPLQPRALAALLAVAAFVVVVVVPMLKYPANPPSVGNGETIGYRTVLFFAMLAASIFAASFGVFLRAQLLRRLGGWNATLAGVAAFAVIAGGAMVLLPAINEVPGGFPAALLWQFRVAALGTQAVLWTTLGLAFGALTQRSLARR